ncbi:E3 ubiquitin-protein ligase RNF186-like [Stegostoma tigrinum]|uniref:E3 ubiquitin-protein ligase RNF186-like n=1 Tax=Stegostoma tigrinum TaxID=3053191 RepID=UPI00202AF6E5|nr:E3 ubiquitin-protein ligase RNF186-like [Stegostoma tigrinum]
MTCYKAINIPRALDRRSLKEPRLFSDAAWPAVFISSSPCYLCFSVSVLTISVSRARMDKMMRRSASATEQDCPICFNKYDSFIRKPKLLACQHCFCAICLKIMVSVEDGSWVVTCPLCRRSTLVMEALISNLPDNPRLMGILSRRMSAFPESVPEVLLSPHLLLQTHSSTCTLVSQVPSQPNNENEQFRNRITTSAIRRFLLTMIFFLVLLFALQYFFKNPALTWILIVLTVLCALTGLCLLYFGCQDGRNGPVTAYCNCLTTNV